MTATKQILLRVSTVEHAEISRLSGEAGQSLSRFIVSRTLGEGVQAPALELARARAALQVALRALDDVRDQEPSEVVQEAPAPVAPAPVVEAAIVPAIEPEPVVLEAAPVVQVPSLPEPEIVFVSAPGPGDLDGRDVIRWVKQVGKIDRDGVNGHAIHAPAGKPDFLKDDTEVLLRPGTLVVAQAQQKNGRWPVLVYGWTVSGQRRVQWALDDLLDWSSSKISTLQELRQILRRGPPGSPEPAPEPVSTVEVRPLTPAEQAVCAELDEALSTTTTTTTNPFDDMIF